ncbi:hypothetical protein NDU88_008754 [Pleurodeles waltl]|uniref:Uncharacterized protein n=1 Tax=Pleurodeles waltl TaxID=8319 RepID=A0AAV7N9B8_PLEWA|nr:hypothetical protein NDU88_008754 [Pleurodeles waltl]
MGFDVDLLTETGILDAVAEDWKDWLLGSESSVESSRTEKGLGSIKIGDCARPTIGALAQQYPGSTTGPEEGDPDVHHPTANQVTTAVKGGVVKPTSLLSRKWNISSDSTGRRITGRSGAEKKTPEQGENRRRLPDIQVEEQEAARQADRPRSGESVAPPVTVL